jgi:hypothetical protein
VSYGAAGGGDSVDVRLDDLGGRGGRSVVPFVGVVEGHQMAKHDVMQPEVRRISDVAEQSEHAPAARED